MSYFNECEYCGAALDPGEKCECRRNQNNKEHERNKLDESNKNQD